MTMNPADDSNADMRYFGKYRGTVANNLDPKNLGRLQVQVPSVLGSGQLSWAMPCVHFAGPSVGFFALPPIGANIWVEFEGGDLDLPIWTGCFWGIGEIPAVPALPGMVIIATQAVTLELRDLPGAGGVTISAKPPGVASPASITIDVTGIELSTAVGSVKLGQADITIRQATAAITVSPASTSLENGGASVELTPAMVRINGDALEVM